MTYKNLGTDGTFPSFETVTKCSAEMLSAAPATLQNLLAGFQYDLAGNMVVNGSATYTYDAENQIKTAGGVTYVYDGDGKRVNKSLGRSESGLEDFGARYNASSLGRFMTPDWAARPTTVPYAVFGDPQSLNLYGYVRNDPVSQADVDGHYFVVGAQDQKFYRQALTDLYRRPGGRELVNSLANSDRPVILDRGSLDTANTGQAAVTNALTISGQPGVAGAHVTVGTDADLMAGAKMAPGKVSPDVTTGHELEHTNDGIAAGQNSLSAGAAAMTAGDAPSAPGANNTIGGTAQARAEGIMGEKTDMSKKDASSAVQGILNSGQQQWQNNANRPKICSQNQGACH